MADISKVSIDDISYDIKDTVARAGLEGKAPAQHTHTEYATHDELSDYSNQNSFSEIIVGEDKIDAGTTTDSVTLVAGENVTLATDTANKTITISATGGGSGNANIVTLTRAEYDALPDTKLTDGIIYLISDEGILIGDDGATPAGFLGKVFATRAEYNAWEASDEYDPEVVCYIEEGTTIVAEGKDIAYDNTGSKLIANNLQSAIDEVNENKIDNSNMLTSLEQVSANTDGGKVVDALAIKELQTNFQGGVDSIYNAVVAKGSTPASKNLSDVVAGIENISSGAEIILVGTYTGNQSAIDLSSYISVADATKYTSDNFLPVVTTIPNPGGQKNVSVSGTQTLKVEMSSTLNVKATYTASTRKVAVSGMQMVITAAIGSQNQQGTANAKYNLYFVK